MNQFNAIFDIFPEWRYIDSAEFPEIGKTGMQSLLEIASCQIASQFFFRGRAKQNIKIF